MTRVPTVLLSCSILGVLACGSPPPNPGGKAADKKAADKQVATKADAAPPAKPAEPPAVEPPPAEAPADPAVDPAVADPSAVDPAAPPSEAPAEDAPPAEDPNAGWKPPPDADIRSDAVIPPGTPADNAEAFKKLPKAKADGAPVSSIGPNGIHFDTLVVGRGWEKSRCVEATNTFKTSIDDRVNICLRAVHPADVEDVLTVEWNKAGTKSTRRSTVTVKAMHAYLTRSYLPIKPGYEGEWTATIKTADGTVLAQVSFTVE